MKQQITQNYGYVTASIRYFHIAFKVITHAESAVSLSADGSRSLLLEFICVTINALSGSKCFSQNNTKCG